ncbi:MAG: hypothetical protein ACFFDN_50720 [Candidatus Hodarchaeota archaeon]
MMRNAYYYYRVIPPKEWLIYASLIWPRIKISPYALIAYRYIKKSTNDLNFLKELSDKSDIIDFTHLKINRNLSNKERKDFFIPIIERFERIPNVLKDLNVENDSDLYDFLKPFIDRMEYNLTRDILNTYNIFDETREKDISTLFEEISSCEDFIKEVNELNWNSLNQNLNLIDKMEVRFLFDHNFNYVFPDTDFFYDKLNPVSQHAVKAKSLINFTQAIVPRNIKYISVSQVIEFREIHKLSRLKFENEANNLFEKELLKCSTEKELLKVLKLCEDFLNEQIKILEINYRKCKFDAIKKGITISFAGPALLNALASALHFTFYDPVEIISSIILASADILLTLEKGKSEIQKSPWAYLLKLKEI